MLMIAELKKCITWILFRSGITSPSFIIVGCVEQILGGVGVLVWITNFTLEIIPSFHSDCWFSVIYFLRPSSLVLSRLVCVSIMISVSVSLCFSFYNLKRTVTLEEKSDQIVVVVCFFFRLYFNSKYIALCVTIFLNPRVTEGQFPLILTLNSLDSFLWKMKWLEVTNNMFCNAFCWYRSASDPLTHCF